MDQISRVSPVILCFQWVEKHQHLNCAACDFFLRPSDAGPDSGLWSLQTSFYAECYGPLPLEFLEKLGEFQAGEFDGTLGKFVWFEKKVGLKDIEIKHPWRFWLVDAVATLWSIVDLVKLMKLCILPWSCWYADCPCCRVMEGGELWASNQTTVLQTAASG